MQDPGQPFDPDAIRALLSRIVQTRGQGNWQVIDDLVDAALDQTTDWFMTSANPGAGQRFAAFACGVLRNLIRFGPPRRGLDRRRVIHLNDASALESAPRSTRRTEADPPTIEELPNTVFERLTAHELRAFQAIRFSSTMATAAAIARMSPRDLRNRLHRATTKIRQRIRELSSPPPFMGRTGECPQRWQSMTSAALFSGDFLPMAWPSEPTSHGEEARCISSVSVPRSKTGASRHRGA